MLKEKKGAMLTVPATILLILGVIVFASLAILWFNGTATPKKIFGDAKDMISIGFNSTKPGLQNMLNGTSNPDIIQSTPNNDKIISSNETANVNTDLTGYKIEGSLIDRYGGDYNAVMKTVGGKYYALINVTFDKKGHILIFEDSPPMWKEVKNETLRRKYFVNILHFKNVYVGKDKNSLDSYHDVPVENVNGVSIAHLPQDKCNKAMWKETGPGKGYWGYLQGEIGNCLNS
jgi:hypothetical protein